MRDLIKQKKESKMKKHELEQDLTSQEVYSALAEGKLVELFKDVGTIKGYLRFEDGYWYYREQAATDQREHVIPRNQAADYVQRFVNSHNAGVAARNAERNFLQDQMAPNLRLAIPPKTLKTKITKKSTKKK